MRNAILGNDLNDPGHLATPFDGSFSLPIFYVQRKNKENLSIRSLNFLKNAPLNSILFSSLFIFAEVSNVSYRVKTYKKDGNTWNYLHNRLTSTKYD